MNESVDIRELFLKTQKHSELLTLEQIKIQLHSSRKLSNSKSFGFKKLVLIMLIISIILSAFYTWMNSEYLEQETLKNPTFISQNEHYNLTDSTLEKPATDSIFLVKMIKNKGKIEFIPIQNVELDSIGFIEFENKSQEQLMEPLKEITLNMNWDKEQRFLLTSQTTKKDIKALNDSIFVLSNGQIELKTGYVYRKGGKTKNILVQLKRVDKNQQLTHDFEFRAQVGLHDVEIGWFEENNLFNGFFYTHRSMPRDTVLNRNQTWNCPLSADNIEQLESTTRIENSEVLPGQYEIQIDPSDSQKEIELKMKEAANNGLNFYTSEIDKHHIMIYLIAPKGGFGSGWRVKKKKNPIFINWEVTENKHLKEALISVGKKSNTFNFTNTLYNQRFNKCECMN